MRNLTALAFAAAILVLSGCEERSNMRELPDRGGHAYRTGGAERTMVQGALIPYENETFHVVVAGDNLKTIAQRYGITEAWLIRRNRMNSSVLELGSNVIVPKQAPATAKPAK
jgi:hypothetical protein